MLVISLLEQQYHLTDTVVALLEQLYGIKMVAFLAQYYGDAPVTTSILNQWYGDATQLRSLLEQPYEDAYMLRSVLEQPYTLPEALISILEQRYSIGGTELTSILEQQYNISDYNMLRTMLVQPFSLLDDGNRVITHPPLDGVIIAPASGP